MIAAVELPQVATADARRGLAIFPAWIRARGEQLLDDGVAHLGRRHRCLECVVERRRPVGGIRGLALGQDACHRIHGASDAGGREIGLVDPVIEQQLDDVRMRIREQERRVVVVFARVDVAAAVSSSRFISTGSPFVAARFSAAPNESSLMGAIAGAAGGMGIGVTKTVVAGVVT